VLFDSSEVDEAGAGSRSPYSNDSESDGGQEGRPLVDMSSSRATGGGAANVGGP